jgi:hypothetical protein
MAEIQAAFFEKKSFDSHIILVFPVNSQELTFHKMIQMKKRIALKKSLNKNTQIFKIFKLQPKYFKI